jgi:hypothetical protein
VETESNAKEIYEILGHIERLVDPTKEPTP